MICIGKKNKNPYFLPENKNQFFKETKNLTRIFFVGENNVVNASLDQRRNVVNENDATWNQIIEINEKNYILMTNHFIS